MSSAWVDVGELLVPLNAWVAARIEFPVGDGRAPVSGGKIVDPPYAAGHTVGAVRTAEGATRWSVMYRTVGGTTDGVPVPEQARLLGDRISRALCDQDFAGAFLNAIDLGISGVVVSWRETTGDGHEEPGQITDEWVETFVLTLQRA
jgi:hypothetical protein